MTVIIPASDNRNSLAAIDAVPGLHEQVKLLRPAPEALAGGASYGRQQE